MAAVPPIEVKVTADTKLAEAGLQRVENALGDVGAKASATGKSMVPVSKSLNTIGSAAGTNVHSLRNVALQLSQVGQQASVTGNFMGALAIQLPDILGGFGGLPAVIAGAAIGLGTALLPALIDTTDQSEKLKKQLDALSDAMSAVNSAQSAASVSVSAIVEEYGRMSAAAREVLLTQREIANLEAAKSLGDIAKSISESFGELEGAIRQPGMAAASAGRDIDNLTMTARVLAKEFGISRSQGVALAEALREVGRAEGPAEQVAALRAAREQIELAAGGLENMDEKTYSVYKSMLDAELAAARLAAIDVATNIGAGADEAGRMAGNMAASLELFNRMSAAQKQTGPGRGGDPRQFMNAPGNVTTLGQESIQDIIDRFNRGRTRGGGRADPLERNLERIREALATERELLTTKYEEQQEMLRQSFEKRMLTQDEFQNLSLRSAQEYQDALAEIERAKNSERLNAISGAFGDLSTLMNSENKKLFKIGKAAAIAEATISGYQAATDAWAKGMKVGGPPVAAAFTAASLAKTGALIAGIASQQIGGGGGTPATGGTTPSVTAPETRTVSEIRFLGNLGADGQTIVDIINSEYDRGNFVRAVVG